MPELETNPQEKIKADVLSHLNTLRRLTDKEPTAQESVDFEIKNRFKYIGNFFQAVHLWLARTVNDQIINDENLLGRVVKFLDYCEEVLEKASRKVPITKDDVDKANQILDECISNLNK